MKKIERTSQFRKNYRRVKSNPRYRKVIDGLLEEVRDCFMANQPLPQRFHDHALTHNWKDYRECRLKPDLLLIYRHLDDGETVEFSRLGSHSNLFGL